MREKKHVRVLKTNENEVKPLSVRVIKGQKASHFPGVLCGRLRATDPLASSAALPAIGQLEANQLNAYAGNEIECRPFNARAIHSPCDEWANCFAQESVPKCRERRADS